ncbi:Hypothetical protein R9X50_00289500 [Acrodontium crateriforme]|uniref:CBF1-interacting co-repressor CIR N-terminal domain-containing protein n=1 Tax=Acrodontium crateriforme TaxID=150365 RepID=A0AAQ3M1Q2_9PEZI|nr:Hypothetical protein R9X50_00289500 [Acrodontium crateriforme]
MVLHLLSKKSWHVYNSDNVERVRRDEAHAQAKLEADEQRMQQEDAARRVAILRGEEPVPLSISSVVPDETADPGSSGRTRERPQKRRRGEDDTDREIRFARENADAVSNAQDRLVARHSRDDKDVPLVDHKGHLQLVPMPSDETRRQAEKNAQVEAEKAKKRKRDEDQYTMRFSNAAGFQTQLQKPWYAAGNAVVKPNVAVVLADVKEKDVWGNADPRRKEREQARISRGDPFAAMQQAQQQLRQSARDREKWEKQRAAEVEVLKHDEGRRRQREKSHRKRAEEDDLENFTLDGPPASSRRHHKDTDRHGHVHRQRQRSRSPSRERHHRHSSRRHRERER